VSSGAADEIQDVGIDGARDLFVQALISFQQAPEDDWFSYYQIAGMCLAPPSLRAGRSRLTSSAPLGIHGLPFKPWNSVGQVPGGNNRCGFCPHGVRQQTLEAGSPLTDSAADQLRPMAPALCCSLRGWPVDPLPLLPLPPRLPLESSIPSAHTRKPRSKRSTRTRGRWPASTPRRAGPRTRRRRGRCGVRTGTGRRRRRCRGR